MCCWASMGACIARLAVVYRRLASSKTTTLRPYIAASGTEPFGHMRHVGIWPIIYPCQGRLGAAPLAVLPLTHVNTCPHPHARIPTGLAAILASWLDEEWTPLEVHGRLGQAAAQAYGRLRQQQGLTELSDVLLGMSTELLAFDFNETFTGPFEVANKVCC